MKMLSPFLLFLFFFTLYLVNFIHLSPVTFNTVDRIYGTDTENYIGFFKGATMDKSIIMLREGSDLVVKRPAFAVAITMLLSFLEPFHIQTETALLILYPLISAFSVVLVFFLFNSLTKDKKIAFLFTVFYGFSFSILVFSSISSPYVLTNLIIVLYWFIFIRLNERNPAMMILFMIFPAMGSFFNPSLMLLVIPTAFTLMRLFKKRGIPFALLVIFMNPIIWAGVLSIFSHKALTVIVSVGQSNFETFNLNAFFNVSLSFIFYSIINPIGNLSNYSFPSHFWGYFQVPVRTILLLGYLFFLFVAIKKIFRKRFLLIDAILLWFISMLGFHIFVNPAEAMAYSSQAVFPLTAIYALCFKEVRFRHKDLFLVLLILMMIVNNLSTLYTPILELSD